MNVASTAQSRKAITLRNLLDDSETVDALYFKAAGPVKCTPERCTGSLLSTTSTSGIKTKEILMAQAIDFINQFYAAQKRENTKFHTNRLAEVKKSIERFSTYELTESELAFAARSAWRNAVRCIGRIQWSKLQVFDCRNVRSTKSMFEAMCNHLKYATNNGNIRSAATIFPQRKLGDYTQDYKVWNGQFLGYAGYRQPDGTVIGDRGHIEITDVCLRLGWKGKGTEYDILPLVFQANGCEPQYYEIPPELALEVKIIHPTYPWFAELGLKWYCVPGVSNMLLDAGGLEFTACPFSGWYMSTEIGRDFADENRYDKLPIIAEKMGLDTRANVTLWKDKALVELNLAILYSFQKAGVTIVDHHSAAESFMTHYENEKRLRGGCPADWVWVVPPMSSHLTPVFHLEMLNYVLKPSYEYQVPAWRVYDWEKEGRISVLGIKKAKYSLKEVVGAIIFANRLMSKALANRIKCTILYATETGRSEKFAKTLADTFQQAFNAKAICMQDYDAANIRFESLLLVVTSTFGNGDAPDNGEEFRKLLYDMVTTEQQSGTKQAANAIDRMGGPLNNVRFSVFGLGNSSYPKYCSFAVTIDEYLEKLGAERVHPIALGDELGGQEKSFYQWANEVFNASCDSFSIENTAKKGFLLGEAEKRLSPSDRTSLMGTNEILRIFHNRHIPVCTFEEVKPLNAPNSTRKTDFVRFSIKENRDDFVYAPGDHMAIYPENRDDIVDAVLERLKYKNASIIDKILQLEVMQERLTPFGRVKKWIRDDQYPFVTLKQAFKYLYDITTPLSQKSLASLIPFTSSKTETEVLRILTEDKHEYELWKYERWPTLAEIFEMFPMLKPTANHLISILPKMQPRYFSISSSPLAHPDEIHLTVAVVKYIPKKAGRKHYGVCSTWLDKLQKGTQINAFVRKAPSFRLPTDFTLPILLIGAGTGMAPFRSFWQDRQAQRLSLKNPTGLNGPGWGEMVLYFGCRSSQLDELYKDEVEKLVSDSTFTEYCPAYSREPDKKKVYVQDNLLANGKNIYDLIQGKNGHIYICGDVTMAAGVHEALEKIFKIHGKFSDDQLKKRLDELKDSNILHEDIFGNNINAPLKSQ